MPRQPPVPVPDDDPDPIIASYKVYLKPTLPPHQKLIVLQHMHKPAAPSDSTPTATELRIKPNTGMVEVDVPLDTSSGYDRAKGKAWGAALANSARIKAGGSYGLAGGFGISGPAAPRPRGGRTAEEEDDDMDWAEAVRQGKVLSKMTYGGVCPVPEIIDRRYMVGVFQGENLHLTPVTSMVQIRPQLHHLDAATEAERLKQRESSGLGGSGGGSGGSGGKDGTTTARAIHMTVKSADGDGDGVVTETMADRLRAVQMEPWKRMQYSGEQEEPSWNAYEDNLILKPRGAGAGGKGKEKAGGNMDDAVELKSKWTYEEYKCAFFGLEKPKPAEVKPEVRGAASTAKDGQSGTQQQESPKRGRPGRPRGSTTRGGRGGKAQAGSSRTTAMDID